MERIYCPVHITTAASLTEAALRVKKVAAATFSRRGKDSTSAEAGIFHCQLKLTAVKNVRYDFGKAEIAPPDRQSRSIRFQSADGEFV